MSSKHRLSATSYIVLSLIHAAGEATPYDLKRAVAATLGNFGRCRHAQVYAEPERLAAGGFSQRATREGRASPPALQTDREGEEALQAWLAEPTAEMAELRDPGISSSSSAADPKALAAAQLWSTASAGPA
jgi:DNA-binding PadR family transcriptional regulator